MFIYFADVQYDKMKICMLSIDFLPNVGGIAAHVYELSKALVKQGNEVHVITFRDEFRGVKYEEIDGIKVHRIYLPHIRLIGFFVHAFFELLKLKSLIKNKGIDIIHSHTIIPDALVAKFIGNTPYVETEHSSGFLEAMEKGKHIKLYKWLLSHADYVIGPSKELVDTFIGLGTSPYKASFISNGVDTEKFNQKIKGDEIREKDGIAPEEKVILCPRRLEPKNGVYYFIKAIPHIFRENNNVKCLIVGDGSEMDKLKSEVTKLEIFDKVIFAGIVSNSEMPKYYAASDIVVLPSLKEATSIAGLEAMASGKPLVGTNVGGIPQIIADGETGLVVPPKNPKMLARAINSLLINDEKRIEMGLKARKLTEKEFSWDVIAKKTLKIYEVVLKRP